jgi:L,D-transpeptidase catalytic domain/Bacterial SH3 domain
MAPLVRVFICVSALVLCILPSAAQADRWSSDPSTQTWAATTDLAYLRTSPDLQSDPVARVRAGTALRIIGDAGEGNWSSVFEPRTSTTAYIRNDLLVPRETPSAFVYMAPPPVDMELDTVAIATEDLPLYFYPSPDPRARALNLEASNRENIVGTVKGVDGASWYATEDGYFLQPAGLFMANAPEEYGGRWLDVSLSGSARVVAYDDGAAVRSFHAIKGVARWPTPQGAWAIVRRVQNETMDSNTIGIPRNAPGGYFLKNVLYTQYFRETGESLHYNYWSSAWGAPGSHGCLGLSLGDSKWLWEWADVGTPVLIHQ